MPTRPLISVEPGQQTHRQPGCPRDLSPLTSCRAKGCEVWRCGCCHGLWLPPRTVETALGANLQLTTRRSSLSSVNCPQDGSPLVTIRSRGVEVDVCQSCHGVWLDRGELERILNRQRPSVAGGNRLGMSDVALGASDVLTSSADIGSVADLGGAAVEMVVEVVAGIFSGL